MEKCQISERYKNVKITYFKIHALQNPEPLASTSEKGKSDIVKIRKQKAELWTTCLM